MTTTATRVTPAVAAKAMVLGYPASFMLGFQMQVTTGDVTSADTFTGYEGLLCGFSAFYTGIAQVLNEVYGKTVLPLGVVKK